MVSWSSLVRPAVALATKRNVLQTPACKNALQFNLRQMSGHGHEMVVQPSRFQWQKFKDLLHYYVMIGVFPIMGIVLYCNIFIGPAQLTEIPEDYVPKHWEYEKHPISRFLARYVYSSHQQEYEKMLHHLYEENEKAQIRRLEQQIREKMSERNDYQAYYYRPASAKYARISKEAADYLESIRGTD